MDRIPERLSKKDKAYFYEIHKENCGDRAYNKQTFKKMIQTNKDISVLKHCKYNNPKGFMREKWEKHCEICGENAYSYNNFIQKYNTYGGRLDICHKRNQDCLVNIYKPYYDNYEGKKVKFNTFMHKIYKGTPKKEAITYINNIYDLPNIYIKYKEQYNSNIEYPTFRYRVNRTGLSYEDAITKPKYYNLKSKKRI